MDLSTKHLRDLFGGNVPVAQVLQGIAAGLADCGVTVVIDPRVTVPQAIPSQNKILLPAHVKSERALLIVSWYLDHETGHIIFTPPPEGVVESWKQQSRMLDVCKAKGYTEIPETLLKTAHFFLNCVEDARIENLMVRRFPGCKKHFIGGPIALDLQDPFTPTLEKAKEIQAANNLPHPPLNPFFVGELHANSLLNGKHGQLDKDYIRGIAPPHVGWVLDIVDDNFGDIRDVCSVSCEDLAERVDKAMALILEKKLPDMSEAEEDTGDQEGEQQGDDRFAEEFDKPKKSKKKGGKGKSEEGESDDDTEDGDDSGDGDESDDSGDGSDSDDDEGDVGDEDGSDSEGESESEDGEGSASGDSDGDEEDESDSGSDGAGSDSMSDTGDDEGDTEESPSEDEAGDGDGDEEDGEDGSDGDSEEDDSEGDEGDDGEDDEGGDRSEEGDEEGEGEGEQDEEADAVTGDIEKQADFKQLIEWAEEAQTDMAQMMREAQAAEEAAAQGDPSGDKAAAAGSPVIDHSPDADGMPDEYLARLNPGVQVVVIADQDLTPMIQEDDPTFREYDRFIQELMPKDLGPAARRLMGKFKSAPGKAWQGNRVNPKMLQPIVSGHAHGRPLYLRRQETVQSKKGVCVMLCIDCSGSMISDVSGLKLPSPFNSKFSISHAAGRGIARLLQRVQVPFAVMGYTTMSSRNSRNYNASRAVDIVNFLFKDFHEPWTTSEQKMLAVNAHTRTTYKGHYIYPETNSDGESLLWAATRIITRPEDRKIMIVLSDGLPAAGDTIMQSKFLKWAVRRIEIAGIHIGALGIGDRGVIHYYRVYELLDSFPTGWGDKNTAPYLIQEKLITLIDRLATDGQS